MPWCAALRDRPVADGDERGLPGPRGSRADGPVPAGRPAGRVAAGLDDDALDADLERRRGRRRGPPLRPGPPGRRHLLAGQGHAEDRRSRARSRSLEERAGPRARRAGATPGRSTTCRPSSMPSRRRRPDAYEHRVVAWTEVGEEEGTGIVHIAPGCGAEDFQLGKALGLPVIGPIDEVGRLHSTGSAGSTGRDVRRCRPSRSSTHLEREGRFYRLEPYNHRYPHCWRCGTPLVFRLVDEWYISMGQVYDQPRETLTQDQVDASLRYQIMEVVDQIRWIPGFGYERELDWLLQHARLDDQQEALLGPGAADLRLRGVRHLRRHRRPRGAAGASRRGLGRVRGPHAAPAVRGRGQDRLPELRRAGVADPGRRQSVARRRASCRSPRCTSARTPTTGRSGSRPTSSPRASPASSATGSTRCSR